MGEAQDPVTRLKGYLAAVRRRWWLVLVVAVVGAALGWFTAPERITVTGSGVPATTVTYYRASFVLAADPPAVGPSGEAITEPLDLNRAAYLVNTGEVPQQVAEDLELPADEVQESLLGLPREAVNAVEVQGFATSSGRAEALADAAATNLQDVLQARAVADAQQAGAELQAQIDTITGQIASLDERIGLDPAAQPELAAERDILTDQYRQLLLQQVELASDAGVTPALSVLQTARTTRLTKDEYETAKEQIRNGADYVTGAPITVPEEDEGTSPGPSVGASRSTRAALGGILGLGLGVGLVLLLDRLDSRLRRRERVEAVTGYPVVAEIPSIDKDLQASCEVVAHLQHRSRAAEAYREVRGALLYAMTGQGAWNGQAHSSEGATVVMVTSAGPAEGKTTTAANMAAVLAEGGMSVVVINCDFRRPLIQRYLLHDGPEASGTDVATTHITDTEIEGVRLITGIGEGDPEANPLEVVAVQRKVIDAARPRFDVILLDTAPILATNDASELFDEIDHLMLVVRAGQTRADAARRSVEILERFEVPVLGVVLNDSSGSTGSQYYYYDGYTTDERRAVGRPAAPGPAAGAAEGPAPEREVNRRVPAPTGDAARGR